MQYTIPDGGLTRKFRECWLMKNRFKGKTCPYCAIAECSEDGDHVVCRQFFLERLLMRPLLLHAHDSTTRHGNRTARTGGHPSAATAAMVAWFLMLPPNSAALVDNLVSAHVHSLLPDQLVSVISTDRHTVKPWFAGHADVSPAVADFEAQGYKLIGGRSETIDGQRAAVVVYRHGPHTISVFSWASDGRTSAKDTTRNGYHLAFWEVGNLEYCAVSDTGWNELESLATLLRTLTLGEEHPVSE